MFKVVISSTDKVSDDWIRDLRVIIRSGCHKLKLSLKKNKK